MFHLFVIIGDILFYPMLTIMPVQPEYLLPLLKDIPRLVNRPKALVFYFYVAISVLADHLKLVADLV